MRKLADNEILSISNLLQMETNALALSRATIKMMEDEELKTLAQTGIKSAEARVKALQQFISENGVLTTQEVH